MQNFWASSLFKGRIGEAIVEAVLSEFGYTVRRAGSEFALSGKKTDAELLRLRPDLIVRDPMTGDLTYVEVKARTALPFDVVLEKDRLDGIRQHHPGTVLIFVSAFDGSVNCAQVDEMLPSRLQVDPDGFCHFDLLGERWKPIWHFFPLVKKGAQLGRLWAKIKREMHTFGHRQLSRSTGEMFEGERDLLEQYVNNRWHPVMRDYGVPELTKCPSLSKLREIAHSISAFSFARDLIGRDNVDSVEFRFIMEKALSGEGSRFLTLDLREIREILRPYPLSMKTYEKLLGKATVLPLGADWGQQFLEKLYQLLPRGEGRARLVVDEVTMDDYVEVDLRTAIGMLRRRNRLDS